MNVLCNEEMKQRWIAAWKGAGYELHYGAGKNPVSVSHKKGGTKISEEELNKMKQITYQEWMGK